MTSKWKIIKDCSNYSVSTNGEVKNNKTGRILKPLKNKDGYLMVNIKSDDGKYYYKLIHRLVALTFIPNPLNKGDVNHKDYNPSNNCIDNLEWMTRQENCKYSSLNISKTHKGVKKSNIHKISISKSMINKLDHHIYKNGKNWMFRFRLNGIDINKTFKAKNEAIQYRDKYLEGIDYEFNK